MSKIGLTRTGRLTGISPEARTGKKTQGEPGRHRYKKKNKFTGKKTPGEQGHKFTGTVLYPYRNVEFTAACVQETPQRIEITCHTRYRTTQKGSTTSDEAGLCNLMI